MKGLDSDCTGGVMKAAMDRVCLLYRIATHKVRTFQSRTGDH